MKFSKVIFLLLLTTLTGLASAQTVHYTRTGKKYHREGCRYLRTSDFTCSLSEALSRGLTPCSRCAPPTRITPRQAPPARPATPSRKPAAPPKRKISYRVPPHAYEIKPDGKVIWS